MLGVPPPFAVTTSPIAFTSHPSGTGPMSESTKRVGSASKTGWGMEGKAVAPAALAFTGSKSTNHARKIARASRSSARAVRRFCSILSSSAPRTPAMARCSSSGGSGNANSRSDWRRGCRMPLPTLAHVILNSPRRPSTERRRSLDQRVRICVEASQADQTRPTVEACSS